MDCPCSYDKSENGGFSQKNATLSKLLERFEKIDADFDKSTAIWIADSVEDERSWYVGYVAYGDEDWIKSVNLNSSDSGSYLLDEWLAANAEEEGYAKIYGVSLVSACDIHLENTENSSGTVTQTVNIPDNLAEEGEWTVFCRARYQSLYG